MRHWIKLQVKIKTGAPTMLPTSSILISKLKKKSPKFKVLQICTLTRNIKPAPLTPVQVLCG